jgi:predicted transposase/invertase (TIGR01784 family)
MCKKIEDLTFIDDGMFQAVMHEPGISEEIVERLLHVKVDKIVYPELEKPIKPFYTTKGVRLDVYLKDDNRIIDVELQTYKHDAIGKRTRYYQSMIDIDSLMKGQDYSELLDSYVLFICTFDPFQKDNKNGFGLPCYTFRNTCKESPEVSLDDKAVKVIYNASAYEAVEDKKVRDFLHFVMTNDPAGNDFNKLLSDTVERIKENDKFRSDYAAMNLHDRDIIKRTQKEAIQQKAVEAAINLLKMNILTTEQIAEAQGLPLEKVLELQKEISVKV